MAHSASNLRTKLTITGEEYCKTFGHLVKPFGDGKFCINCDKPAAEIMNEKWAAGSATIISKEHT